MKKFNFNFNPKFNINTKVIIFGISTLIFLYLLYLSIPSLYKSGRVQKVLSDEILSEIRQAFINDGNKRLENGIISYGATIYRVSAKA